MVVSVFPPEKRGRALGTYVASIYAGLSCGPSLGGLLITALGWRSLFYVCVPLGVATFLVVLWKLRGEWAEARGEPFDWQGSVIYAGAILSLITGAATLATRGWAWGLVGAGVVGLCVFVWVEARTTYPVLNVELLRKNRVFALSNVAALFNYAATFGVTFFMSLYLQYVRGMTPRQAGIFLVVQPLAQALLSPACGRLSDRVPAEWVATAGMALCSLALGVAAAVSAATPMWMIAAILLSLGTGFALFSSPNASVIMGSVAPKYLGVASGLAASMRTLGMMASMAVITVILSICMKGQAVTAATQGAFLLSMRTALVCFSLLCLLGIGCSLGRLRRTRAGVGTEGAVQSVAGK
jgi:MFS family permease